MTTYILIRKGRTTCKPPPGLTCFCLYYVQLFSNIFLSVSRCKAYSQPLISILRERDPPNSAARLPGGGAEFSEVAVRWMTSCGRDRMLSVRVHGSGLLAAFYCTHLLLVLISLLGICSHSLFFALFFLSYNRRAHWTIDQFPILYSFFIFRKWTHTPHHNCCCAKVVHAYACMRLVLPEPWKII
jgi:hypothetical protein